MKKIISFTFLLAFFFQVTNSFAQQSKVAVGLELGPNRSQFYGNVMLKQFGHPETKFYQGMSFQYNFSRMLSLRTGLAFEQKGHLAKHEALNSFGMPIGTQTYNFTYSYLTVPVLVRATFGERLRYFVNAGPYAGYALKQTIKVKSPQLPDFERDDSNGLKQTDFGISFGAGAIYPVGSNVDLSFEIRNNGGLVNISKAPLIGNGSIKTNALNFLLGCSVYLNE